jgi:ABC-type branched-subunit amino acid transport system permease subunit
MDWGSILQSALLEALGPTGAMFALAAIGLNIHFGYAGLLNFGQAGFMAVGAYGLAASVQTWGLPFGVGILVSLLASVVLAILLGVPTLRLRADYLAIVTIGAAEIIRISLGSVTLRDWFGGSNGRQGFNDPFADANPFTSSIDLGIVSFRPGTAWAALCTWIVVAISCVIVWALMRSPWGRVLKSIREDEEAVRSLGKNVFAYKMQALVLGGLFGSLAGLMGALGNNAVVQTNYASDTTFYVYAVLLVGGAARVLGPVVGSLVVWFLLSGLGAFFSQAARENLIPDAIMSVNQASLVRFIILGVAIMLLMIYRPQGIFGDRRELAIDGR